MEFQDTAILIGGAAGLGVASIENVLTKSFKKTGFHIFASREYMSRIRGGSNTSQVRVSTNPIGAPRFTVDIFVALDKDSLVHAKERLCDDTIIIGDKEVTGEWEGMTHVPLVSTAKEIGKSLLANTVASGYIIGLLGCGEEAAREVIQGQFRPETIENNLAAFSKGYVLGRQSAHHQSFCNRVTPDNRTASMLYLNGTQAVGYGCLAGGCGFVSSYPMSPSTGVFSFLAAHSNQFGILIEQAEDEIAAFQFGQGIWYAGGRAMTTTSGGGFALMAEGISLAAITETPMVVYLAQRPGPATGLPTRTEQGDLELAIYAGHGEFPIVVLAPGDLNECFCYAEYAFQIADRCQIPVVVLSDQYLADSGMLTNRFEISKEQPETFITKTTPRYKRYAVTKDGISPRGIPGYGKGIVRCDSDEHTEEGLITESMAVRNAQNGKRLRKVETALTLAPDFFYGIKTEIAIIGWGSTKKVIEEVLGRIGDERLYHVHYPWVYPLGEKHLAPILQAQARIVVENNATGQFSKLLAQHGIEVDRKVLKSDGMPFFVDELEMRIRELLREFS